MDTAFLKGATNQKETTGLSFNNALYFVSLCKVSIWNVTSKYTCQMKELKKYSISQK